MNGPVWLFECPHQEGMHIWEDSFSGGNYRSKIWSRLPMVRKGELVMTSLQKEGMPLWRYRTKI